MAVRLCCGQEHSGVVCPDGKVMCCLCFLRFEIAELNVGDDGRKEDVCRKCAEEETKFIRKRLLTLIAGRGK